MKYIREQKGISQNQLARESRSSRAYLYRLEKGLHYPGSRKLEEICGVLGISVSALFEYAENHSSPDESI